MAPCGVERFFHERFVREYDRFLAPFERRVFAQARARLLAGAHGRVLDLGAGTGSNFQYLAAASTIVAVDSEPRMLAQARQRISTANVPISLVIASGEALPFCDATFDTVIMTLVLCTIPDARRALDEVRRVLVRNGRLLLLEHVRSTSRALAVLQDVATPIQRIVAAGCHLNRNTVEEVAKAGFKPRTMRRAFAGSLVEMDANFEV